MFHLGVNIIRGSNSSGKSTIADFIFYVLGGDFVQWKPEAQRCDAVIAEVLINGEPVTLRRYVSDEKFQPMELFWGDYTSANSSIVEGWLRLPYSRSSGKESFSQVLFRALGFPEVTGDKDSNITMHQILRLLAVDQLSRVHSLMRDEQFDSPLTRRTVGDVVLGLFDDSLYSNQIKLRELKKNLAAATGEYSSLSAAFANSKIGSDLNDLIKLETDTNLRLVKLSEAIISGIDNAQEVSASHSLEARTIGDHLVAKQRVRQSIFTQLEKERLEIVDSEAFIKSLEGRLSALDESALTEAELGRILLHTCPECFQTIDRPNVEGSCKLCGQHVADTGRHERINRMRHELSTQIKESKSFFEERQKDLLTTVGMMETVDIEIAGLQRNYSVVTETVRSDRDRHLDEMFSMKGGLEQELRMIAFQRQLAQQLEDSAKRVKLLKVQITSLEFDVKRALERQNDRKLEATQVIDRIARYFLHKDLPREDAFKIANEVVADFDRNICEVDGRVNFSASSITYLRSAVNFAIFLASLELPFFRYPRFIVNDNIEDKGMEEARSQNFQRLIVEMSQKSLVSHQIIITTSMIAPEFDGTELCVGDKYHDTHKTLRFL